MNWINKGFCYWCGSTEDLDEEEVGRSTVNICGAHECLRELRSERAGAESEARQDAEQDGYERYM